MSPDQLARQVALDQIEAAARWGRRDRLEYWVQRLLEREMATPPALPRHKEMAL